MSLKGGLDQDPFLLDPPLLAAVMVCLNPKVEDQCNPLGSEKKSWELMEVLKDSKDENSGN